MGILSGIMGNAAGANIEDVKDEYGKLLGPKEEILQAFSGSGIW